MFIHTLLNSLINHFSYECNYLVLPCDDVSSACSNARNKSKEVRMQNLSMTIIALLIVTIVQIMQFLPRKMALVNLLMVVILDNIIHVH